MYIQVSLEDFDEAQPGERVLGTWRKALIVTVVLGEEVEHRPSRDDDPNTEYRCFVIAVFPIIATCRKHSYEKQR
jgi:hypothetical protein